MELNKRNTYISPAGDDWDDIRPTLLTADEMTNTDLKVKQLEISEWDSDYTKLTPKKQ